MSLFAPARGRLILNEDSGIYLQYHHDPGPATLGQSDAQKTIIFGNKTYNPHSPEMLSIVIHLLHLFTLIAATLASTSPLSEPRPFSHSETASASDGISVDLFASLERLSRLVDIAYCVGTTGIRQPFSCLSRCKDFPSLELVATWNTGVLLSDSCGYLALDHGAAPSATELLPVRQGGEQTYQTANGAIIVAFRGTYSITNAVIDLSTVPQKYVPYPPPDDGDGPPTREPEHACTNCTVHMGFLLSWQIARQTVLPQLKRLHEQYPNYSIHVTGHSLGGAVGALAALEMKIILGWENIIVTTFGEPRVGNLEFIKYLNMAFDLQDQGNDPERRAYRRITHVDDPVPLLPLSEWGYRPHGGELFISKPELSPRPSDIRPCAGDDDPNCIAGRDGDQQARRIGNAISKGNLPKDADVLSSGIWHLPARLRLWELLFAHRDYFWRLGLCIPGGDPFDWGRDRYPAMTMNDEL
ncbi:putative triacylglycerol lipase [Rosellinia necatrix]|uniref:Putative triacylglycerol lipase n=1 Tax=Rosellinia necatrix TaxID=77044 RepID=A0A1W2TDT1_ROSNE|nr:putative triacylglycerol lipase [Rosellinia necatrix]